MREINKLERTLQLASRSYNEYAGRWGAGRLSVSGTCESATITVTDAQFFVKPSGGFYRYHWDSGAGEWVQWRSLYEWKATEITGTKKSGSLVLTKGNSYADTTICEEIVTLHIPGQIIASGVPSWACTIHLNYSMRVYAYGSGSWPTGIKVRAIGKVNSMWIDGWPHAAYPDFDPDQTLGSFGEPDQNVATFEDAYTDRRFVLWPEDNDAERQLALIHNVKLFNSGYPNVFEYSPAEFFAYTPTDMESLGAPDNGTSVPMNLALADAFDGKGSYVAANLIEDMQNRIEFLCGYVDSHMRLTYITWNTGTVETDCYPLAMGNRTKYGGHGATLYDWTYNGRTTQSIGGLPAYDIIIGEVYECIMRLKNPRGAPGWGIIKETKIALREWWTEQITVTPPGDISVHPSSYANDALVPMCVAAWDSVCGVHSYDNEGSLLYPNPSGLAFSPTIQIAGTGRDPESGPVGITLYAESVKVTYMVKLRFIPDPLYPERVVTTSARATYHGSAQRPYEAEPNGIDAYAAWDVSVSWSEISEEQYALGYGPFYGTEFYHGLGDFMTAGGTSPPISITFGPGFPEYKYFAIEYTIRPIQNILDTYEGELYRPEHWWYNLYYYGYPNLGDTVTCTSQHYVEVLMQTGDYS